MTKQSSTAFEKSPFNFDFLTGIMPFGFDKIAELQQKNMTILSEIQKKSANDIQEIGERQVKALSRIVEDQVHMAQQLLGEGTLPEKISRQTDLVQKTFQNTIEDWKDLTDLVNESGKETIELLNKHTASTLAELKTDTDKKSSK